MRHYIFTSLVSLFAVSLLFQSCSKESSEEPQPDTSGEKSKLQTNITGKWIVQSSNGRITADDAFLEFLSDSTYIIYNVSETLITGKFSATSGTEISLGTFGALSEIKFTQDKIGFKLTYSNKILTITANKTAAVDASDKTKMLSHLWSLTADENGSAIIGNSNNDWNEKITKWTIRITSSGSYLVQLYNNDRLFDAQVFNWKWHSTKSDRIVFWSGDEPIQEEKNYSIIREVTGTTLKTLEYQEDENRVLQPVNYTLKRLD